MSKKKNKHNKQHRSLIEAQKAEMKSFEYASARATSAEMKSTELKSAEGKKESELMTHQLPIAQIKKDFTKIVLYLLFTITVLVYFRISGLDLNAIRGFLRF